GAGFAEDLYCDRVAFKRRLVHKLGETGNLYRFRIAVVDDSRQVAWRRNAKPPAYLLRKDRSRRALVEGRDDAPRGASADVIPRSFVAQCRPPPAGPRFLA